MLKAEKYLVKNTQFLIEFVNIENIIFSTYFILPYAFFNVIYLISYTVVLLFDEYE